VPWTLTLTSGTNPFFGGVKLNCALAFKWQREKCLTMPVQTKTSGLEWRSFTEPIKSELTFSTSGLTVEATPFCQLQGINGGSGEIKAKMTIAGIEPNKSENDYRRDTRRLTQANVARRVTPRPAPAGRHVGPPQEGMCR